MSGPNSESICLRLDTVNLVENNDGLFTLLGPTPQWFADFGVDLDAKDLKLENYLLFFDTYLLEIRDGLERDPYALLSSGPWSETDKKGQDRNLSAQAFLDQDTLVIQIKLIAKAQQYQQTIFQQARSYSLKFEQLIREREHKEILLHTIVHDLTGPLTSIHGVLELMKRGRTTSELTQIALEQCVAQKDMIQTILETFVSESSSNILPTSRSDAPDILSCARQTLAKFHPAFENRNVTLRLVDEVGLDELMVVADKDLLERVFSNLLENALRYSPSGSKTELHMKTEGDFVQVSLLDQGPGVSEEMKASIFDRYIGGGANSGKAGLGLYFCKIAVERWGGTLNFETRTDGPGSCFEFRLPKFDESNL